MMYERVKDPTLIYMPSDRAVLKPRRLWDGKMLSSLQNNCGEIPFADIIVPGIGTMEFHSNEHWVADRYFLRMGFTYGVYDRHHKPICLTFDAASHYFTPAVLHSEFDFADGSNKIIQEIAAIDDVFCCQFTFAQGGSYKVNALSGKKWSEFSFERFKDMILVRFESDPYRGVYLALHASFCNDHSQSVLNGRVVFHSQIEGAVEKTGYLLLGIDDNKERLLEKMKHRISIPQAIFTESKADWQDYYTHSVPQPPDDNPDWANAIAWAAYYFKSNLISNDSRGAIKPFSVGCGKGSFTGTPIENTQYHIIGELHLKDISMAMDELLQNRECQDAPWSFFLANDKSHQLFNACILRRFYEKCEDNEILLKSLNAIEETVVAVLAERDRGDGLYWTQSHLETPMGFDNSSRWDAAYTQASTFEWPRPVLKGIKAVEASCFIVDSLNTAAYYRRRLGFTQIAAKHSAMADRIAANIRTRHWSKKLSFFVDLIGPDDAPSEILTLAGVAPLWAGIATPEQAWHVAQAINDPRYFRAKYGPTTHAMIHEKYSDYWRGDVALRMSWMAFHGLRRYGFEDIARYILDATLQRFKDHHWDGAEMWNPESGIGYWTQSAEMGLLVDMIMSLSLLSSSKESQRVPKNNSIFTT